MLDKESKTLAVFYILDRIPSHGSSASSEDSAGDIGGRTRVGHDLPILNKDRVGPFRSGAQVAVRRFWGRSVNW